jgi:hypothetical protein
MDYQANRCADADNNEQERSQGETREPAATYGYFGGFVPGRHLSTLMLVDKIAIFQNHVTDLGAWVIWRLAWRLVASSLAYQLKAQHERRRRLPLRRPIVSGLGSIATRGARARRESLASIGIRTTRDCQKRNWAGPTERLAFSFEVNSRIDGGE